jgi:hypothetical protein
VDFTVRDGDGPVAGVQVDVVSTAEQNQVPGVLLIVPRSLYEVSSPGQRQTGDRGAMTTTGIPDTPGITVLRHELAELLAVLSTAYTIDAEDEALEELAGWAETRLGHGWEPLYDGVRPIGVAGALHGAPVRITWL